MAVGSGTLVAVGSGALVAVGSGVAVLVGADVLVGVRVATSPILKVKSQGISVSSSSPSAPSPVIV